MFRGLGALQTLDLRANRLEALPTGILDDNPALVHLELADNRLASLPRGLTTNTPKLTYLGVVSNGLDALPDNLLSGLFELRELHLNDNRLAELDPRAFADLAKLELLHLERNQLRSLPQELLSSLASLREIHLQQNRLSQLSTGQFAGLSELRLIDLHENELSTLPKDIFRGLAELRAIILSRNDLSSLPEGVFRGLGKLERLELVFERARVDQPRQLVGPACAPGAGTQRQRTGEFAGRPIRRHVPVVSTGFDGQSYRLVAARHLPRGVLASRTWPQPQQDPLGSRRLVFGPRRTELALARSERPRVTTAGCVCQPVQTGLADAGRKPTWEAPRRRVRWALRALLARSGGQSAAQPS